MIYIHITQFVTKKKTQYSISSVENYRRDEITIGDIKKKEKEMLDICPRRKSLKEQTETFGKAYELKGFIDRYSFSFRAIQSGFCSALISFSYCFDNEFYLI
jgi:hypothetical protein